MTHGANQPYTTGGAGHPAGEGVSRSVSQSSHLGYIHASDSCLFAILADFDEMEAFQDDGEDYLREAMEEAAKYRKCSREMMLAAKGRPNARAV